PRQRTDPDLATRVAGQLAASVLDPSRLHLEITETSLIDRVAGPGEVLDELHHLGVSLVIDDFGTGYSSLSRLGQLSVSALKIDRSFVAALDSGPRGAKVVAAMVNLGHALDLHVKAEGIETESQLSVLRELGCDGGQGFFIARPMPPSALGPFVRQGG